MMFGKCFRYQNREYQTCVSTNLQQIKNIQLKSSFPLFDYSTLTLTGVASFLIFPHETASSGLAPLSLPSKSHAVLMKTAKSAPFL